MFSHMSDRVKAKKVDLKYKLLKYKSLYETQIGLSGWLASSFLSDMQFWNITSFLDFYLIEDNLYMFA